MRSCKLWAIIHRFVCTKSKWNRLFTKESNLFLDCRYMPISFHFWIICFINLETKNFLYQYGYQWKKMKFIMYCLPLPWSWLFGLCKYCDLMYDVQQMAFVYENLPRRWEAATAGRSKSIAVPGILSQLLLASVACTLPAKPLPPICRYIPVKCNAWVNKMKTD